MIKKLTILLASLVFSCVLHANALVNIQHWQTHNGVSVLFVAAPQIPMLDIAVVFKAGAIYDQNNSGLAVLTNAMLNEGAGQFNADQLADQLSNIGALFNNNVDKETSIFTLRTLIKPHLLTSAVQNFSLIINAPTFPQTSVDRLKQQMLVSLNAMLQQPDYIAGRTFAKTIWGKSAYANAIEGTLTTLPQLTRDAIVDFYHHYYVTQNALIFLVGDVSQVQAAQIAEQVVGQLPSGSAANFPDQTDSHAAISQQIDFPTSQNTILIGEIGVPRTSPDYFPLQVGNYILGGPGNLGSILMSNVREKFGLTYGVSSNLINYSTSGAFAIMLKSRNNEAARATELSKKYLADFLNQGPTAQQLADAKNYLSGSFPLSLSSNSAILAQVAEIGYYHLPWDYLDTYRNNINSLTAAQIKTAFARNVDPTKLVTVAVGGKADASR